MFILFTTFTSINVCCGVFWRKNVIICHHFVIILVFSCQNMSLPIDIFIAFKVTKNTIKKIGVFWRKIVIICHHFYRQRKEFPKDFKIKF
jgi:hypothetical protein